MNAIPYRTPTEPSPEELRDEQVRSDPNGHPAVRRILARHTGDPVDTGHPERTGVPSSLDDLDSIEGIDGDQLDLADRQALRRVAGLSTELEDVSEVEYRRLRLERVVLAGLWARGGGGGPAKPPPRHAPPARAAGG